MTRRIPLLPTLVVAAAVAAMVALGVWQLRRAEWKEGLLARYEAAAHLAPLIRAEIVHFPTDRADTFRNPDPEELYFRRAVFVCSRVLGWRAIAGRNGDDEPGYAHVARCDTRDWITFDAPNGGEVVIGWSRSVEQPDWTGGDVAGTITPGGEFGWRLVADPPLAGLEANAPPDPNDLPNNHLMYAGQWFFFALTALVIYVLALRKRWRGER